MSTKQLYEKTSEGMKEVSPLVTIEGIYSKLSDTPLEALVSLYNHVKCEWKGSVVDTRRTVPLFLRRSGLFITYNNGIKYVTEFFSAGTDQITTEGWVKDSNWTSVPDEDYISAGVKPGVGSIGYEQLNDKLKQLFREKVNVTNYPDDEDITSVDNMLKLKDREVNAANFQSKGYVILRKNLSLVNGVVKNILTQNMINKHNTIYEIKYDFDLNGETIEIQDGCKLYFNGGKFHNGCLLGNGTEIEAGNIQIFENISKKGLFVFDAIFPEWFGAIGDNKTDSTKAIQDCFDFAYNNVKASDTYIEANLKRESLNNDILIRFQQSGKYIISSTIDIPHNISIDFNNSTIIPDTNGNYRIFNSIKYLFTCNVTDNGLVNKKYCSKTLFNNLKVGKHYYYIPNLGILYTGSPISMNNVSAYNIPVFYTTVPYTNGAYLDNIRISGLAITIDEAYRDNGNTTYMVSKNCYGDYAEIFECIGTNKVDSIKGLRLWFCHNALIHNSVNLSMNIESATGIKIVSNHFEEISDLTIWSSEVDCDSCFFWRNTKRNSLINIAQIEGANVGLEYRRSKLNLSNICIQTRFDLFNKSATYADINIYPASFPIITFKGVTNLNAGQEINGYVVEGFTYKIAGTANIYANRYNEGTLFVQKEQDNSFSIKEISNSKTIAFDNLVPSSYSLNAITINNDNGLDSGSYKYKLYVISDTISNIGFNLEANVELRSKGFIELSVTKPLPMGAYLHLVRTSPDGSIHNVKIPITYTGVIVDRGITANSELWRVGDRMFYLKSPNKDMIVLGKNNQFILNGSKNTFPEGNQNCATMFVLHEDNPEYAYFLKENTQFYYSRMLVFKCASSKKYVKILNSEANKRDDNFYMELVVYYNVFAIKISLMRYLNKTYFSKSSNNNVSIIEDADGNIYLKVKDTINNYKVYVYYPTLTLSYGNLKEFDNISGTEIDEYMGENISKGTTVQRPHDVIEGFEYYDTTLKKKILWNGTAWVNLDGTELTQ